MQTREFFVWVEKYRPQTIKDCILTKSGRASLEGILAQGDTPHLMLAGTAGTGKTTVAKALAADLDADTLVINGSLEGRLMDTLRTDIADFASGMSLTGKRKYIILDEADNIPHTMQAALRGFMEEFAGQAAFIFTCNFPSRIIEPIHSRCSVVDFRIPDAEKTAIAMEYTKRTFEILKAESVKYNPQIVLGVVQMYFPDFRRVLNELQRFSATGELSEAILSQLSDKDVTDLFIALKAGKFDVIHKWNVDHSDMDEAAFYHMLSTQIIDRVVASSLPETIIMIGDYNYRSALAADKSLNQLACLLELMKGAQFK